MQLLYKFRHFIVEWEEQKWMSEVSFRSGAAFVIRITNTLTNEAQAFSTTNSSSFAYGYPTDLNVSERRFFELMNAFCNL